MSFQSGNPKWPLIAVDEFHHVSAAPDSKLGQHLGQLINRNKVHIVAMTGSYFRGDAMPVLAPQDESKYDTVTYTYYEQLNGYDYLKQLDIGYFFYSGPYGNDILKVLEPTKKTIAHIPSVNPLSSFGPMILLRPVFRAVCRAIANQTIPSFERCPRSFPASHRVPRLDELAPRTSRRLHRCA